MQTYTIPGYQSVVTENYVEVVISGTKRTEEGVRIEFHTRDSNAAYFGHLVLNEPAQVDFKSLEGKVVKAIFHERNPVGLIHS